MKPTLLALTSATLLTSASAQGGTGPGGVNLRLYGGFGEVRQPVTVQGGRVSVPLPVGLYQTIIPDSLDLDGALVTSRSLVQQPNWLASLEGRQLTLREDGKVQRVTLVRARDLLVRDAAGQYRTVDPAQLSYDVAPPLNPLSPSWQASFVVSAPTAATTPSLTYLSRALSWSPRYTLKLSGGNAALSALADLRNTSDESFNVFGTELFAGEVQLQSGGPLPYARTEVQSAAMAADSAAPKVNGLGELRGLYRYALDRPFVLPAGGTVSLPFLNPQVSVERFGMLDIGFSPSGSKGTLGRGYRLKASTELPAGSVTVREDGRLVGQVGVETTPANTPLELNLGSDPDLRYTRTAATTAGKTQTIRVTYTFENAKDRPLRFEVTEEGLDSRATVSGDVIRTPQGGLSLRVDVPAKGKLTRSFSVTLPGS